MKREIKKKISIFKDKICGKLKDFNAPMGISAYSQLLLFN